MAWDHLNIDKPHLAYAILGGFTSLFMLVSLSVKEKLYIGEATVATICGIIFGPYGFKLFDPQTWGNVDRVTLECSRIVLVVQCFAVGVELPKRYMNRHWKSVVLLLLPVMTWGWLVTSLFIWWMIPTLSYLESLACAACVTATDPVLASSVVGKGKFARRIPKHLRDLLSAESGCNDGMAFPFIYLALYLIRYMDKKGAAYAIKEWFLLTILYECIFGAIYGFAIGYAGRRAIRYAEDKGLIDRESFLVFYFVLALFCAGTGSMLGLDDLLVGFCAGVGFSNDGWFSSKTEESHVSNVIDLLLNLAYFVYFGSIIPWKQFNAPEWGLEPWRLVVIALLVLFFRRLPIMVLLKPVIPDVKTWRESFFAGHFGPIGVGAIFIAILARAELEHGAPTPLAVLPPKGSENYVVIEVIWPITTFLVITSIIVHGSSIAVFTLGKRINTMTISMSYTIGTEENGWLNRLPKLQSRLSASFRKPDLEAESESDERLPRVGDEVPDLGVRRAISEPVHGAESPKKRYDGLGRGTGVPADIPEINQQPKTDEGDDTERESLEAFEQGNEIVLENREGDVIAVVDNGRERGKISQQCDNMLKRVTSRGSRTSSRAGSTTESPRGSREVSPTRPSAAFQPPPANPAPETLIPEHNPSNELRARKRSVANAFRIDDTVILEDEEGEVIKRYRIPKARTCRNRTGPSPSFTPRESKKPWDRLTSFFKSGESSKEPKTDLERADTDIYPMSEYDYDGVISEASDSEDKNKNRRRFRMHDSDGRNLTTQEMVERLKNYDAHSREMGTPSTTDLRTSTRKNTSRNAGPAATTVTLNEKQDSNNPTPHSRLPDGTENPLHLMQSKGPVPLAAPSHTTENHDEEETAAEKKRREAALGITHEDEDDADNESENDEVRGPRMPRAIRFADHPRRQDKGKGRA